MFTFPETDYLKGSNSRHRCLTHLQFLFRPTRLTPVRTALAESLATGSVCLPGLLKHNKILTLTDSPPTLVMFLCIMTADLDLAWF
ncbi:hypothetical protein PoB_003037800 [Plakobranchus ocellatus]|uniref:Uncharacterized protein n=1 Tax=Plakobranchus ocellatus TaxID=259542 RepID=A0AAV4AAU9_9GAST|nr:hypothetical protein PoB_003037800 [Plakobranchus ocellatus]